MTIPTVTLNNGLKMPQLGMGVLEDLQSRCQASRYHGN